MKPRWRGWEYADGIPWIGQDHHHSQHGVLVMTLNWWRNSVECGVLFHFHYSQAHFDLEW